MTPREAKKIVASFLNQEGLPYTKLTAKTVSFSDLARRQCIFVKVWGWTPNPAWGTLKEIAVQNGFYVEAG